jgi:predicted transglutaminase-like cysteine proteinase
MRALASGVALLAVVAAWGAHEARLQRRSSADGPQAEASLRPLLQSLRAQEAGVQLRSINRFFNRHIEFATDLQAWGRADYWASPLESLQRRLGDCEDYAIVKYFGLLATGMPMSRLRLVYVHAQMDDGPAQAHMVLAYFPPGGGDILILDNLVDEVQPFAQRSDLVAVFSFNGEGLWQGVGTQGAGDPVARLTHWRKVLAKARAEGFP